ncbi:phenylacetate--CoA ligase family protein [Leeuwenhoekiella palythoae]|uniref:Phenylacetate-CoA ligase n=1 Tax=Leeuwenhoekiella palythoae TaxID=573501 RepID=A0A1M5VUW5_9FLAO|nr:phenylacetate--CoA ligase family protein [Leeuwenhoekiella palythoae]RXG31078.1 phenylacetate-CoA ligase [Leeuwenhoekiella palythoae]SHH79021.1 phenylacetate-CoA ligase [Leeuwenhoekiella palythoae]
MNLINLSLHLNGYAIATAQKQLQELKQQVEHNYAAYIETKKTEILKHHLKNTPFYKNLVGDQYQTWEDLPVLTKQNLQQALKSRLSKEFSTKNVHVHKTSGSSGTPFIFAKDKFCHALTWASITQLYSTSGIDLHNSYEARFYGIPKHGAARLKERLKDRLSNRYRFSIFDTSDANFESFISRFKKEPFGHLNGYTSALVLFARYLAGKKLVLKDLCPSLTHCIATAEMLFKEDIELLQKQFGVPVINEYGASETGIIALGKAGDILHIDSSLLYVEILDEVNRPVDPGTSGKIVVTSLFNKAHPFIRYEIGDLGVLSYQNGLSVLTKLEGRVGDFALLPDGKKIPALAFYYVTKEIMNDTASVKEFKIIQNKPNHFSINYVADAEFSTQDVEKIKRAMLNYLGTEIQLSFNKKPILDRSKRGKLKQFTRTF